MCEHRKYKKYNSAKLTRLIYRNIPYDVNSPGVRGAGPHDSLINLLWYYYEQKPNVIARWVNEMGCGGAETYPTVSMAQDDISGRQRDSINPWVVI